jgi:hypothetical protein
MADLLPVHTFTGTNAGKFHFRTSDVYGETGGVGAKVGIKKVKETDLTGKEEILPIKELLRTGLLMRIGIRYKNSAGKKKSAKVLALNTSMTTLFADGGTAKLEGENYKVGTVSKGSITGIGMIRRASTY